MKNLLLILTVALSATLNAQLSSVESAQITDVLRDWNQESHPGGVLGVMQGENVIYLEAFGLANVEYNIPNTTETIFNIASISKQFTAMAIVRLEEEGKLSFDDEIQKHLPNIPMFDQKITIRHLMHHTSGLRSLHGMLEMAGWRGEDPRHTEDLFRFMERQKDLNFEPGNQYEYCNTGYNFMAQIVENITGEDFIEWTKKNIFEPLEMKDTYFEEDYSNIVPNNASSYYKTNNGFRKAVPFWGYMGSGNAHTTVSDLMMWYKNFTHPKGEWGKSFETLRTKDVLNDGSENEYAFGIVMDKYKGVNRIQHGGAIGGYRAFAASYPDQDLTVILLTNFTSSNVKRNAEEIAEKLLRIEDQSAPHFQPAIFVPVETLKLLEGHYWNDHKSFAREIKVDNDTLWYVRSETSRTALEPLGNGQFRMLSPNRYILEFDISDPKNKTLKVGIYSSEVGHFDSYTPKVPTEKMLKEYIGVFYSPELDTKYTLSVVNGKLQVYHPRLGELSMELMIDNVGNAEWPLGIIRFKRNKKGKIIGMYATNGRVKNLWFEKE